MIKFNKLFISSYKIRQKFGCTKPQQYTHNYTWFACVVCLFMYKCWTQKIYILTDNWLVDCVYVFLCNVIVYCIVLYWINVYYYCDWLYWDKKERSKKKWAYRHTPSRTAPKTQVYASRHESKWSSSYVCFRTT